MFSPRNITVAAASLVCITGAIVLWGRKMREELTSQDSAPNPLNSAYSASKCDDSGSDVDRLIHLSIG